MAQLARPIDNSTSAFWVNQDGSSANLYASVDEITLDTADYVETPEGPNASVTRFLLSGVSDPGVDSGWVLNVTLSTGTVTSGSISASMNLYASGGSTTPGVGTLLDTITSADTGMSGLAALSSTPTTFSYTVPNAVVATIRSLSAWTTLAVDLIFDQTV